MAEFNKNIQMPDISHGKWMKAVDLAEGFNE